ncbi:MAG: hypothetical protein RLZZ91_174 [Bacteroidota bacterium]|jgi:hypothetical protein
MRFSELEKIVSKHRMKRYLQACTLDKSKAVELYLLNIQLSSETFKLICFFEIAFRNSINNHLSNLHGHNWLEQSISPSGFFNSPKTAITFSIIQNLKIDISKGNYNQLITQLGFGFWRHLFAPNQYKAIGSNLLEILIHKPKSTSSLQINQKYIFKKLTEINDLRNRIAHHEPICFKNGLTHLDISDTLRISASIVLLLEWMNINTKNQFINLESINSIALRAQKLIQQETQ